MSDEGFTFDRSVSFMDREDLEGIRRALEKPIEQFDALAFRAGRAAISWIRSNGADPLVDELLDSSVPKVMGQLRATMETNT
jgi:hypothetical protein